MNILNELQLTYALHLLNCKHEYGYLEDTMTLLKHIDKPLLILIYEELYLQLFLHNYQIITKQQPNEIYPMFHLL